MERIIFRICCAIKWKKMEGKMVKNIKRVFGDKLFAYYTYRSVFIRIFAHYNAEINAGYSFTIIFLW